MIRFDAPVFINELESEADHVLDKMSKAVSDTARYAWVRIVEDTPVDTGRARFSWNITTDPGDFIEVPAVPRGTKNFYPYPIMPDFSFDVKKDSNLYVQDNVEYIEYLEEGSRTVEAQMMVQGNLPNINRILNIKLSGIK